MNKQDLLMSFLALEETIKGILQEKVAHLSSSRKISPDGIKYYNILAKSANKEISPSLMIFNEETTPNLVTHPKTLEVLNQVKLAIKSLIPTENPQPNIETKQNNSNTLNKTKPRVFIGCSVEGISIAKILQLQLEHSAFSVIWNQGVFGLSSGTLETLVAQLLKFDYAILVLTPDDIIVKRDVEQMAARDNVMFELGLFMGGLGREKTFIVCNKSLKLPSDLAGITPATFQMNTDNLVASLGPVCTKLEIAMNLL